MNQNMYEWMQDRKQFISESKVKNYMHQLFKALEFMHSNYIFHRDIKPENILLSSDLLKIADLGSCKSMNSGMPCTEYISTRWYRPPECLMTDGYYDYKMDIWGAGCVFFEVLALHPLFQGSSELDQIHKIHDILGTPDPETLKDFQSKATHMKLDFLPKKGTGIDCLIPHVSLQARDLITQLLAYKSEDRINATQALSHPYFKNLAQTKSLLSITNFNSGLQKCFSVLPPIRANFPKRKNKNKNDSDVKNIGLSRSPEYIKKSILELRKAYAPSKNFYISSY
jgi:renal tumor antigen